MAKDYRVLQARINQERADVQKALAAAQADLAEDLTKKGEAKAGGGFLGGIALPAVFDYAIGGLLDAVAPGAGRAYQAAKQVPILKATGTGLLRGIGTKAGSKLGDVFSADVAEADPLVNKYLTQTGSGMQAKRFDRGATTALGGQRDLQLSKLDDMVDQTAQEAAMKGFLSSLGGDLLTKGSKEFSEKLDTMRGGSGGELSAADYTTALRETLSDDPLKKGGELLKSAFDFTPLSKDALRTAELAKLEKLKAPDMDYMDELFKEADMLSMEDSGFGSRKLSTEGMYSPTIEKRDIIATGGRWDDVMGSEPYMIIPQDTNSTSDAYTKLLEEVQGLNQEEFVPQDLPQPESFPSQPNVIPEPQGFAIDSYGQSRFPMRSNTNSFGLTAPNLMRNDRPIGYDKILRDLYNSKSFNTVNQSLKDSSSMYNMARNNYSDGLSRMNQQFKQFNPYKNYLNR